MKLDQPILTPTEEQVSAALAVIARGENRIDPEAQRDAARRHIKDYPHSDSSNSNAARILLGKRRSWWARLLRK